MNLACGYIYILYIYILCCVCVGVCLCLFHFKLFCCNYPNNISHGNWRKCCKHLLLQQKCKQSMENHEHTHHTPHTAHTCLSLYSCAYRTFCIWCWLWESFGTSKLYFESLWLQFYYYVYLTWPDGYAYISRFPASTAAAATATFAFCNFHCWLQLGPAAVNCS